MYLDKSSSMYILYWRISTNSIILKSNKSIYCKTIVKYSTPEVKNIWGQTPTTIAADVAYVMRIPDLKMASGEALAPDFTKYHT